MEIWNLSSWIVGMGMVVVELGFLYESVRGGRDGRERRSGDAYYVLRATYYVLSCSSCGGGVIVLFGVAWRWWLGCML